MTRIKRQFFEFWRARKHVYDNEYAISKVMTGVRTCENETTIDSYQFPIYATFREDINYDYKVDMKDIGAAAKAFRFLSGTLEMYNLAIMDKE